MQTKPLFEALGGYGCMHFLLLLSHDVLHHVQSGTRLRKAELCQEKLFLLDAKISSAWNAGG